MRRRSRYPILIIVLGCASLLGVGALALVRTILHGAATPPQKVAQEIHIIRPPPPPPDVPPPPPPPDEKVVDIAHPEEPDPTPSNDPPPSEQLGLDAEGSAGGDAFGLLGHKGGRDLLASGGDAFSWYAGLLKSEILDRLQEERDARRGPYSAEVKVWIRGDGTIERASLTHSTGDRSRDRAIEAALSRLSRISQSPPSDMPQPISLRIVSRA
jgi:periplasmic protein TonB